MIRVSVNPAKIMEDLLGDDRGLLRALKQVLPDDSSEVVLIIDQFEELFSMVSSEATAQLFLDNLVSAVEDPRSRLRVVLTMRADFFDRPLQHAAFGRLVEAGLVPVTVPDNDELAQAIAAPAAGVGIDFEPGLVAQIVKDVGDQPGGLPLLQFALTELFEQRKTNTITLADYQGRGGIFGALGRRAEDTYAGLDFTSQAALRHALLRLVSVDDASDDLRLRVRRADLSAEGIDETALAEVLRLFGAHRLLTFDLDPITRGPTVEVAHEALLREWPRLAGWIDEQRDDLIIRRRLAAAMTEWRDNNEEASFLPTGSRLAQFDEWSAATTLALAPGERQFLQAGVEREHAKEAHAATRRRVAFGVLAGTAAVLAVLAGFAFVQWGNANDATDEATAAESEAREAEQQAQSAAALAQEAAASAETSRLGATAQNVAETLPELGLLVAAEAHNREVNWETLGALQRVLVGSGDLSRTFDLGFQSSGVSADGQFISVWNREAEAQGPLVHIAGSEPVLIDAPTGPIERRHAGLCESFPGGCPGVFSDPEYWARSFSWSADGSRLYRISGEDEVAVWDTATWTEVEFLGGDPVGVSAVDNPLGGSYTAVTHSDGTVRLLDPTTGTEQNLISGLLEAGQGSLVEFASDGALMMSVVNSTARLWDPLSGQQIGGPMVTEVSAPWTKSGEAIQLVTETDSGIHIWNLDPATWFDAACEAAGRNMTRAEWDQFGPRDTEYRATCPQYPLDG